MVCFSFMSFGLTWEFFTSFCCRLSLAGRALPVHGLVTIPLGRVDGWPRWAKVILPFFATAICWWLASWVLNRLEVLTAGHPGWPFSAVAGPRSQQLSALEISAGGHPPAAPAEQLHIFRQTSVLEICQCDGADHFAAVEKNSAAARQGGFRAAAGAWRCFSWRLNWRPSAA
jgi:hypothetical protein